LARYRAAVAQSAERLGYRVDDRGSKFPAGETMELFLCATTSRPALGPTQPPTQWVTGTLTPGSKRPWHEVDHSPPSSAEVKNAWSYISSPNMSSWRGA